MKTWIVARRRSIVAVGAATALLLSAGVVVLVHTLEGPGVDTVDCSTLEAATFDEASPLAHACGADVEVLAERTPWQTSWATSENTARLEASALPSRVLVDGEWTTMDRSLVADPKAGTIEVAAPVYPMQLNAGGDAGKGKPLGVITQDGYQLEVWFPLDLPKPKLKDSQAIYQVAKGIRLVVTVTGDATGFLPVIELANPDAAARFSAMLDAEPHSASGADGAMTIEFATEVSDGLQLTVDDANSVHVVDDRDETQFSAPSPIMWDSSGTEIRQTATNTQDASTDRTQAPAGGDQIASMPVTLHDNLIVMSPDLGMLQSEKTEWPVYIDPGFTGKTASKRVLVRTSATNAYNSTIVGWIDAGSGYPGQGTGYCSSTSYGCGAVYRQRLAWQFTGMSILDDLASSDISAATFTVYGQHSFNCTNQTTTLWRTSDIGGYGSEPNYNNLQLLASYGTVSTYHSNSCGNKGDKIFDALGAAKWAADNNTSTLNLALIVDQSSMTPWKRYINDARFAVTYNRAPDAPTSLRFDSPNLPTCVTGPDRPVIPTTTPTISAISSDPDLTTVQTSFVVVTLGDISDVRWDSGNLAAMQNLQRRAVTVSSGLVDGGVYKWRARAYDGARYSAWSEWCQFAVDTSAPVAPTIEAVTTGVQAIYLSGVERGGVGQQGSFTLKRGASTDVVRFEYYFTNGSTQPGITSTPAIEPEGAVKIDFTPTTTGPVTLHVTSFDAAGNFSSTTNYTFAVASPTEDGIWTLDEGTGSTAADSAGSPTRPLTVTGAAWSQGPHGLFDSRPGDTALSFDGVNDFAATAAPVVDTEGSFVVSAHVLLDPSSVAQGQSFTALGQDGVTASGFQLGYQSSCPGMPNGCWSFSMPDTADAATTSSVLSTVPVTGGEWTYLVGEHNAADGKLRLWVCEIGTPADPAVGDPVKSETTRSATPWSASGAFTVGRGLGDGLHARLWPGSIDNIRVFSGEVLAEPKIRRLCQGAEATDFGGNESALDPTTMVGQ